MAHPTDSRCRGRSRATSSFGGPRSLRSLRAVSSVAVPGCGERGVYLRRVAPVAVMPAAAFAVHQLRYWLAFGSQASAELERQGHSYLHSLAPWIVFLIAIAVGAFLRSLGRALRGHRTTPHRSISFALLWLLCSAALVAIYMSQEFLEGLLATGHPGGLAGIFAPPTLRCTMLAARIHCARKPTSS